MTGTGARFLYLTRHGEATPDESSLTAGGRRQAMLLGRRLKDVPLSAIHHGPLPRAKQTAELIGDQTGGVPLHPSEPAGDYVPFAPERHDVPPEYLPYITARLEAIPAAEFKAGPTLARQAIQRFTGPAEGQEPRHELVITHNFLIAWLVALAMTAPPWRWLGLNHCHGALTVIRYAPERPPTLLVYNDMTHLPEELRWTGFPLELRL
jgi:broad specificity phosphatase PhoE